MKTFDLSNLRGDFFGGLTAGVVALPLALAFGVQSGLGAIAGLYGAITIGMLAAWFGGTPTQISGPTGPMTVVSATIIASMIHLYGNLEAALASIVAIFLLAGFFELLLGVIKIGRYVRYMPYPVVSGFMSGIGVIIIVLQVFPFLGHKSPKRIIDIFSGLPEILEHINYSATGLAIATIAIIYLFPRISKVIPSALVALVVLTFVSTILNLNVAIIGDIPEGLPTIHATSIFDVEWSHPMRIVIPALTLAALGAIDSLLTSIVADNMTKTQHDSNKELIGQGLGNMVTALVAGIPGAGATMRTVVNIKAGGRTRLSGVVHSIALLVVLLGAGTYARLIPLPVLAGILITVGIGIIDYKGIKHIPHVPKTDSVIMLIVLSMTVFIDLLQAVAVGMVMASVLFMKKMSDIVEGNSSISSVEQFSREEAWKDELILPQELQEKVYIKHFDGPIFFGFAARFMQMNRALPEVNIVVMRMERVPYIDQTGIYAIEDAVLGLREKGIKVVMIQLQDQPRDMLINIDLIPDLVPEDYLFSDFPSFVDALMAGKLKMQTSSINIKNDLVLWRY